MKDGIRDLAEIRRVVGARQKDAEARLAQAEVDATAMRKLVAFVEAQQQAYAAGLARLTGEAADTSPPHL